jgi:hypothetical protein
MTDPRSAYIHRSWLVDGDGAQSEGVNKVAMYFWDTQNLIWTKATTGGAVGTNVNVLNFPASYSVLQGTIPWADNISQFGGVVTSLGQKVMASSMPITLASDQSAVSTAGGTTLAANNTLLTKTVLTGAATDGSGYVNVQTTTDGGIVINQNTAVDAASSSTTNLASGATLVGPSVPDMSYTAVQYIFNADQDCTVYIEQSLDGTNWDISDPFPFYTPNGTGNTVQLVASYYRVRVTNTSPNTTTYFRLQVIKVPFLPSLPRSLDANGHLQTASNGFQDYRGTDQYIAPNGELVSVPLYKLVGDSFGISALDPNLWTAAIGVGGTVDVSGGQLRLITGTTANNAVSLTSVRTARFIGLAPNKIRIVFQLPDTGVANNTRRWGIGAGNDRAYFELNGTTFSVVTRKAGVDSAVANGSFNGQWGRTFTPGTASHFYEIIYQPRQVVWLADNKIVHTLSASATTWAETLHFPVYVENFNTAASVTSVSMFGRVATIARFGIPQTQPVKKYIHGAFSGNLKIGPGNLHGVAINSNTGTSITLYDSLTAGGDVIAIIQPNQIVTLDYKMLTFSIGLTAVTLGGTIDCTILYE